MLIARQVESPGDMYRLVGKARAGLAGVAGRQVSQACCQAKRSDIADS